MKMRMNRRSISRVDDVIDSFVNKARKLATQIAVDAAVEMAERIKSDTPVLTGNTAENWSVALNGNNPGYDPSIRGDGEGKVRTVGLDMAMPGDTITIANPSPIAGQLEFGSSDKAPEGMVRVNTIAWADLVKAIALKRKM